MTNHPAALNTSAPQQPPKLGIETVVALAGTALAASLLVLTAMYAGPL